jgi:hypothetical protein
MMRSRWIPVEFLAVVAALVAGTVLVAATPERKTDGKKRPAAKTVTITAGDDGFTTVGEGKTVVDLADYPVTKVFGAKFTGSSKVSFKGKPLSADLGAIDTIVRRPKDIVLRGGKGSGSLEIAALSLDSEKPVSIGGKNYQVHVGLSDTAKEGSTGGQGRISLTAKGGDGGIFSASLPVRPKLVFVPEGGGQPVTIDCAAVPCGKGGKGIVLADKGTPWAMTGGPGNFDPASLALTAIKSGVRVGGEGFASYTTIGTSNFYPAISTSREKFDPVTSHTGFHEYQSARTRK